MQESQQRPERCRPRDDRHCFTLTTLLVCIGLGLFLALYCGVSETLAMTIAILAGFVPGFAIPGIAIAVKTIRDRQKPDTDK